MDIVAVTVLFLTHIEWLHGNAYSFHYVQITDQNLNTNLEVVRPEPTNVIEIKIDLINFNRKSNKFINNGI